MEMIMVLIFMEMIMVLIIDLIDACIDAALAYFNVDIFNEAEGENF